MVTEMERGNGAIGLHGEVITDVHNCSHGGDVTNDCLGCVYSGEFHFDADTGECVRRVDKEICVICGRSVAPGSGWFVNRVPVLDDYLTRKEHFEHPEGIYICAECDSVEVAK